MGTNWVPSMLVGNGFDVGTASYGLTAFNVGGVVGAILGAIDHHASRIADLDADDGGRRGRGRRRAGADADRPAERRSGVRDARRGRAASSTPCRPRCTRWPRTCIRRRSARPASARPSRFGRIGGVLSPSVGQMGARFGRRVGLFPYHRDDDDGRVRRARGRRPPYSALHQRACGGVRSFKVEGSKCKVKSGTRHSRSDARGWIHRVWRSGLDDRTRPEIGRRRAALRLRHQDILR